VSPRAPAGAARHAGRLVLGAALAAALVALVVVIARGRAEQPARCAAGMVALGPRCCGEGQRLEAGRCTGRPRRCASALRQDDTGCVAPEQRAFIAGGTLRVGPGDWEAQGVVPRREVAIAPFVLDAFEIDERRYGACVAAGACGAVPFSGEPSRAVAGVTADDAARFCAWAGGRLPTRDELGWAAAGPASRRYAWGDTGAVCRRAAWGLKTGPCGEGAVGPEVVGSHPDGVSPDGVYDLAGNVAEWTQPEPGSTTAEARGGSWADGEAAALRSWNRRELDRATRSPEIGFRCAYSG